MPLTSNAHAIKTNSSRREMSLRDLSQISIERDISESSQKHLRRDNFLWRLQDVSDTSQKDVFCMTSLRRLEHISKNMYFP